MLGWFFIQYVYLSLFPEKLEIHLLKTELGGCKTKTKRLKRCLLLRETAELGDNYLIIGLLSVGFLYRHSN